MRTKFSFLLLFFFIVPLALAELRPGFYSISCSTAESIVFNVVQRRFSTDKTIPAGLLRMFFHDCFAGSAGCDAAILIDSTNANPSEKDAPPNLTVRGYEVIDEAKQELEKVCPSTVSCADIIALATRDAVVLAGGPNFTVSTGRLDGLRSNPDVVDLPGPTVPVSEALQRFANKGFTPKEAVALLGAHTVGFSRCSFFQERLSNFRATGVADNDMDQSFAEDLSRTCGSSSSEDPTTVLDHGTPNAFDNQYYNQTMFKRGVLKIDQALATDTSTASFVSHFASERADFRLTFSNAMIKLGGLGVLVNSAGEVRQNCKAFNRPNTQPPNNGRGQKPKDNKGRKQLSFPFNIFQNEN